jgi:Family of unknown function (DUF5996)
VTNDASTPPPDRSAWLALPYEPWRETCDTLHAHTQLLGKLAVALAVPEPQLQHAALRLTPRGWETASLPAPDGSGTVVVTLDLRRHDAVVEHSDGGVRRVSLTPHRPVGEVTLGVLAALDDLVGQVRINTTPQEVPWHVPLDEDDLHHTYDTEQVATYFSAATRAALVLASIRAPYRGRVSPVNAWWGSFDLAVSLFSGRSAEPGSRDFIARNSADAQQVEIGWWPGDERHPQAAFFGFAFPAPDSFADRGLALPAGAWDAGLGEFVLNWDDVITAAEPFDLAVGFGRAVVAHACAVCDWDPQLAASALGSPPPVS